MRCLSAKEELVGQEADREAGNCANKVLLHVVLVGRKERGSYRTGSVGPEHHGRRRVLPMSRRHRGRVEDLARKPAAGKGCGKADAERARGAHSGTPVTPAKG